MQQLFLLIPQRTDLIAFCNAFGKFKHGTELFAYSMIPAHSDVAEARDILIRYALLLPRLHERTVVEIKEEFIIGGLNHVHLKDTPCGCGEESLFQALQGIGLSLTYQVSALIKAAALHGSGSEVLPLKSLLSRLIT